LSFPAIGSHAGKQTEHYHPAYRVTGWVLWNTALPGLLTRTCLNNPPRPWGRVRKAHLRHCSACPYIGTVRRCAPFDVQGYPGAAGGRKRWDRAAVERLAWAIPGASGYAFRTALLLARY